MNKSIEELSYHNHVLAYIIRNDVVDNLNSTLFITPPDSTLQVGVSVHLQNSEILRHNHLPVTRTLLGTSEVVFVKSGVCEVDIYNNSRELVGTKEMCAGDIIILLDGGHCFRMLEDTTLFEVKQGPFVGAQDKERW